MLALQESWSDAVASHVVFAYTGIGSMVMLQCGGDPNALPLLPSGFTILPDGHSVLVDGSTRTLLTVSLQVLVDRSPQVDISMVHAVKVTNFLKRTCEKIKHALAATGYDLKYA